MFSRIARIQSGFSRICRIQSRMIAEIWSAPRKVQSIKSCAIRFRTWRQPLSTMSTLWSQEVREYGVNLNFNVRRRGSTFSVSAFRLCAWVGDSRFLYVLQCSHPLGWMYVWTQAIVCIAVLSPSRWRVFLICAPPSESLVSLFLMGECVSVNLCVSMMLEEPAGRTLLLICSSTTPRS